MTQDTQMNRHQLGQLIGANKRDHYYELHYATGEVARLYILTNRILHLLIFLNLITIFLKNLAHVLQATL